MKRMYGLYEIERSESKELTAVKIKIHRRRANSYPNLTQTGKAEGLLPQHKKSSQVMIKSRAEILQPTKSRKKLTTGLQMSG